MPHPALLCPVLHLSIIFISEEVKMPATLCLLRSVLSCINDSIAFIVQILTAGNNVTPRDNFCPSEFLEGKCLITAMQNTMYRVVPHCVVLHCAAPNINAMHYRRSIIIRDLLQLREAASLPTLPFEALSAQGRVG